MLLIHFCPQINKIRKETEKQRNTEIQRYRDSETQIHEYTETQ